MGNIIYVDAKYKRISNQKILIFTGFLVGLRLSWQIDYIFSDWDRFFYQLIILIIFLWLPLLILFNKGLGGADVKIIFILSLFIRFNIIILSLALACLLLIFFSLAKLYLIKTLYHKQPYLKKAEMMQQKFAFMPFFLPILTIIIIYLIVKI